MDELLLAIAQSMMKMPYTGPKTDEEFDQLVAQIQEAPVAQAGDTIRITNNYSAHYLAEGEICQVVGPDDSAKHAEFKRMLVQSTETRNGRQLEQVLIPLDYEIIQS